MSLSLSSHENHEGFETIDESFIWNRNVYNLASHWAKWNLSSIPTVYDNFGLGSLKQRNNALLKKMQLWGKSHGYGLEIFWLGKLSKGKIWGRLWCDIARDIAFFQFLQFRVENWQRICFWEDKWSDLVLLAQLFFHNYMLS